MRRILMVPFALLGLIAGVLAVETSRGALAAESTPGALAAESTAAGQVVIHEPWARASLGGAGTSAAYMTIEVTGDHPDRLIGAASPRAEHAELHAHIMDAGIARMRPVAVIEIAPGTPTALAPGGLHIMLMGVEGKLIEGETLPLSLTFETAGTVALEVPIKGMAGAVGQGLDHGGHGPDQPGKATTD